MKTTRCPGRYLVSTALALTLALFAPGCAPAAEIRVSAGFDNGAVYVGDPDERFLEIEVVAPERGVVRRAPAAAAAEHRPRRRQVRVDGGGAQDRLRARGRAPARRPAAARRPLRAGDLRRPGRGPDPLRGVRGPAPRAPRDRRHPPRRRDEPRRRPGRGLPPGAAALRPRGLQPRAAALRRARQPRRHLPRRTLAHRGRRGRGRPLRDDVRRRLRVQRGPALRPGRERARHLLLHRPGAAHPGHAGARVLDAAEHLRLGRRDHDRGARRGRDPASSSATASAATATATSSTSAASRRASAAA